MPTDLPIEPEPHFKLEPWQARFVEAFAAGESPPRLRSVDEMAVARRRYDKALLAEVVRVGER